jgi:Glycosyltransferase sugar-binding region containing DXD motif/Methyltransferase domain
MDQEVIAVARIPKVLHYTFGMASDFGGKPWSLIHHVCLKSAVERIKPEKVYFYHQFAPTGPWWNLSQKLLTPVRIEAPRNIFGRPLMHVAHQSDVVRLQKLIEHGGIYLDADVLVQRSFDDLLDNSTVIGEEGIGGEFGVGNAVILAEPNAPFLRRWLGEYRSFRSRGRDEYWNEHSVKLPSALAKAHPEEVTILSPQAFFWPLWTPEHLEWIFDSNRSISLDGTYANHLWESNAWKFVDNLTPGRVRARNTNFSRWAAPLIAELPDNFGALSTVQHLQRLEASALRWVRRKFVGAKRRLGVLMRGTVPTLRRLQRPLLRESAIRRRTFQDVYKLNLWGSDAESKFYSGVGSRGEAAEIYVQRMAAMLQRHADELGRRLTIVDLGCGDFQIGRALLRNVPQLNYIGCDIVPELVAYNNATYATETVRFLQCDLVSDLLPNGDVCLVRQVLQHLSNADIAAFFRHAEYEWIYVTEGHPAERVGPVNPDKAAGHDVRFDWRTGRGRGVEIGCPPFNLITQEIFRAFAPPHEVIITERVSSKPSKIPSAPTGKTPIVSIIIAICCSFLVPRFEAGPWR